MPSAELQYKVIEASEVTDESLEKILNDASEDGWKLDTMQFAMRDSSRRPSMAFVIFTRPAPE